MCCKLPTIDEIGKPPGKWCDKCTPGKEGACSIFASPERPKICGEYLCAWRQAPFPPELRPDRCGFIIDQSARMPNMLRILVDRDRPTAYKQGFAGRYLADLQRKGVNLAIVAADAGTRKLVFNADPSLLLGDDA
jgi:hypothetical protein